ncbi:MAG: DUF4258 domain-containing protein [Armatimonadia bacterium]
MLIQRDNWLEAANSGRILWRAHAVGRMLQRQIRRTDVLKVLLALDCVEEYPNDEPYPSVLLFGQAEDRPLHVVAAWDVDRQQIHIVTAYEPDVDHFEADFRRRRTP